MSPTLMTMSNRSNHWSVATAKARLSQVVADAQQRPQIIERRGKAVAVVVAANDFEDRSPGQRWQSFLQASAQLRVEGGGDISALRRAHRRSPLRLP